uniref:DNA-directed DNA polymerase n=1 Tax=Tanacetum cinerariifolium TaxID=118510 RepID=A0A699GUZ0_TANCI|nr:DNA-directed DNA polymerase [Tanacetum cinerariifolium]
MISGFFQNQSSTSGTLLSNTIPNPKGEIKAITTRNGVACEGHSIHTKHSPKKIVERETKETIDKEQTNFQGSTTHIQPPVAPILEPDVLKTLPKPQFLANKDKLFELAKIPLNENCSAMLLKKLPEKLRDPDKFLIPYDFLGMDVCHALADLNASINLMPLSIWKKVSLPELTPTRMTLELANRSITHPKGVAEDVFIKVGKFHFLTDFVVVDFEADPRIPLILGRSFLRIDRGNPTSTFEPIISDSSPSLTPFEGNIFLIEKLLNDDPFQLPPMDLKQGEVVKVKPPKLELKDLPSHLEYAYLEGADNLPMIIVKDLKDDEKEALLKVLKSHKRAIAWKITDIKGIDPRFCTYKILMGEDYKPVVQSQRRVNLKIHEVIKKEVIKVLDAGMIYPISDSSWVSPIHCVPKKGGITVVENRNNELIPTRLVTDCIDAFETLKKNLTEAPILVVPDWNLPFELMCDASDFAVGAVLEQRIDFMGPFPSSRGNRTLRAIISNRGTPFCNDKFAKSILKRTVGENRASWSKKLEDALWAFRTAYKTPIGCTPYKLVYGKSCHLPIKLEHKAYWALKHVNFDLKTAGDNQNLQLNELNELRDQAYKNSLIYKEKTKKLHNSKIKNRIFNVGDRVLLFNSLVKIFSGKLKTRWSGPFTITRVFPYGTVELSQPEGPNFKVNGHHVKHYFGGDIPQLVIPDLQTFPMDK